jgi:hypothetical protein
MEMGEQGMVMLVIAEAGIPISNRNRNFLLTERCVT